MRYNFGVCILIRVLYLFIFLSPFVHAASTIAISAVGDIMLGTDYPYNRLPKNHGDEWFDSAMPWIKSAHVRFGNFEGAFFDGDTQPDGKPGGVNHYIFRTPTGMVSLQQDAGFNVMSLANNHVRDFGLAGFKSTKQTLSKVGIQFSSKSGKVARFNVEQTSIALIAADFYAGARSVTESADTMDEIRELKDNGELVIVSAHVGREGAGADVIIMHGPHVPRGINCSLYLKTKTRTVRDRHRAHGD